MCSMMEFHDVSSEERVGSEGGFICFGTGNVPGKSLNPGSRDEQKDAPDLSAERGRGFANLPYP